MGVLHCGSLERGVLALSGTHTHARWKRRDWPWPSRRKTARCRHSEPTNGSLTRCTSATRRTPTASTRSGGTSSARTSAADRYVDRDVVHLAGRQRPAAAPTARSTESTGAPKRRPAAEQPQSGKQPRSPSRSQPRRRPETEKSTQKTEQKSEKQDAEKSDQARDKDETTKAESKTHGQGRQADAQGAPSRSRSPRRRDEPTYTVLKGAPARTAQNMEASLTVPTATSVRGGPGQAAEGQPHRHQQPPRARPRRQGVLHPPDRLRAGQGAQGDAGDERRLTT